MKAKSMAEVLAFAREWAGAGSSIVQDWTLWEQRAGDFFERSEFKSAGNDGDHPLTRAAALSLRAANMHAVMLLVSAVCFGVPDDVKRATRETSPHALDLAALLLSHIPQFQVVLEAERRFRSGDLTTDWSLQLVDGKLVVRSEFRLGHDVEH